MMVAVAASLMVGCNSDQGGLPAATQGLSPVSGMWSMTRTKLSTTCDGITDLAVSEVVNVIGCDGKFTLVSPRGLWGEGTFNGTSVQFSGFEADTNLFGCKVTLASTASGTRMGERIEGLMGTTLSFDPVTCGSRPDCSVSWAVSMRDLDEPCGCFHRATFSPPAQSPYVLPFPVGRRYRLNQGYCCEHGTHRNLLAVDIQLPLGADVVAAGSGTVRRVIQHFPDDGLGEDGHNLVQIEHAGGTVATYAHLKQSSAVVREGDMVEAGQKIACSGNSGVTGGPHLHFVVHRSWPPRELDDIAVNFRNAKGRRFLPGGRPDDLKQAMPIADE